MIIRRDDFWSSAFALNLLDLGDVVESCGVEEIGTDPLAAAEDVVRPRVRARRSRDV